MKQCPRCKMTTDSHSECPVCNNDISDVEYSKKRWEGYALNKYFLPYFLKKCIIPLCCALFIAGKIIIFGVNFNYYFIINLVLLLYTFLEYLFPRMMIELQVWKYNESYLEDTATIGKILLCALTVLLSFIW